MGLTSDTAGDFLKGTERSAPGVGPSRNANSILQNMPPPPPQMNIFDTVTRAMGQGIEAANTGSVPFTLRDESPYWKKAGDVADATNFQAANGMAAGIPGAVMSALGQKTPSSGNPILDASLSTVGGMVGLPGAAGNVAAQGIGNPLLRGAMRGAGFMGAMPGSVADRAKNAGVGALVGAPLEFATDLGVKTAKGIGGAISGARDVMNPSKTAGEISQGIEGAFGKAKDAYGQSLSDVTDKYGPKMAEGMGDPMAPKTVSFADELNNPKTLAEQTVFNSVKKEAAFQGMDIDNLTADQSKTMMDIFKDKVGQHVVAGEVGPQEINQVQTLGSLKAKQLQAFPEFGGMDAAYGPKAEAYKAVSGKTPALLESGGNRITRAAKMQSLGELDPALESRVKNYRAANSVVKSAKNPIVQGAATATAGVPIVGKFLEAVFKHHQ